MGYLIRLLFLALTLPLYSQGDTLFLQNPSFEGLPRFSFTPQGWQDCGQTGESPPDLHPMGAFGVNETPAHGQSYLGLVARDNGTWEAVGQTLSVPLRAGQCYRWSLLAARSEQYRSISRMTEQVTNYDSPIILRVWGTTGDPRRRTLLLAESSAVRPTHWQPYTFFFQPDRPVSGIVLEAYYRPDTLTPYNGNVLVDFALPIIPIPCGEAGSEPFLPDFPTAATLGLPPPPPLPSNRIQLETTVRRLAPGIDFLNTWPALENQTYLDPDGTLRIDNYRLRLLVAAMRALPTEVLTIGIEEREHLAGFDLLAAALRTKLNRLDAPPNISVRKIFKRDRREEWLVKGGRLYWRVAE